MKQRCIFYVIFLTLIYCDGEGNAEDVCQPESPPAPDNGKVWCNNSNRPNSVCMFTCEPYHTLVGDKISKCLKTINGTSWTEANIECKPDHCEPEIHSLPNGVVTCSHGSNVRSVCHYKCTMPGTSMFLGMKNTNRCLPSKKWDVKPPCCQAPCPSSAKMDAVIIMDSSGSVGEANWEIMFTFVQSLIRAFPISRKLTHFAMFRYHSRVDEVSATHLEDYDRLLDGLLYNMKKMVFQAGKTMTGMALRYAENRILRSPANRPDARDLVILLTDGNSNDNAENPAKIIRGMGRTIIVIAIVQRYGSLSMDRFYVLAGDPSNVLLIDGFRRLDAELLRNLINKICNDICINTEIIQ
uniref:collagen alpha-5(VI) chain-like n=1 Tax=Styela clava TaxID=7725 RepID=UPI0019399FEA|nr:collagen alpha-5(VI) chain-like [Styela clava]